MYHCAHQLQS